MKQLYTFILLIFVAYSVKAQYTLTSAANPVIGDVETTWTADTLTPNGIYPVGGTNQIWNFSGIVISPTTAAQTSSYVAASSAPNASLYPAATIAQTADGMEFEMSAHTSSNITVYGTTNNSVSIVYQNPELLANLPLSFGTNCTDTYSASYTDNSIPVSRNGTVSTVGDGTGTLNLPGNKNFTNVLRIKLDLKVIENYGSIATSTAVLKGYIYVNASSKWSLLSVNLFTSTVTQGTTTTTYKGKSVVVGNALFAGLKENTNKINFNVSPNPSINKEISLNFSSEDIGDYEVSIFNMLGQNVKTLNIGKTTTGEQQLKIDLSSLNSGLYHIKLKNGNKEGTQKLIID